MLRNECYLVFGLLQLKRGNRPPSDRNKSVPQSGGNLSAEISKFSANCFRTIRLRKRRNVVEGKP